MEKSALVIAGSGRSGTTWVLDVLAKANGLRPVFEPLNPDGVTGALPFAYKYIKEEQEEPELKILLEKAFTGNLNCLWTNYRFLPGNLRPRLSKIADWEYNYTLMAKYKKLVKRYYAHTSLKGFRPIVKLIRANLMLDWIDANFNAKIIFVVRHPGAVVASKIAASQKKGGAVWDFNGLSEQRILSLYKNDPQLKRDFFDKYHDIFSEELSPVAGHTLLWCIENVLPMRILHKKGGHIFFYEDLILNPDEQFERMTKVLELHNVPHSDIINKPSQQVSQEMQRSKSKRDQLARWMSFFSRKQLGDIERILNIFEVSIYSIGDFCPNHECI